MEGFDEEILIKGIEYLVNNDFEAAEKYLTEHKNKSPFLFYYYSFVTYVRASIANDKEMFEKAKKNLEASEKMFTQPNKGLNLLKKAFKTATFSNGGSGNNGNGDDSLIKKRFGFKKQSSVNPSLIIEEKLTRAIILADCKSCMAALPFLQHEDQNYLTSALLLKRAWKLYSKVQKKLFALYKKMEPNAEKIYGSDPNSTNELNDMIIEEDQSAAAAAAAAADDATDEVEQQLNEEDLNDINENDLSLETVKRLLGAVSFGYAIFQIFLSMIPPNYLNIVKMFGFKGDRGAGLRALVFASNSKDIRAVFADLVLLWYATIATPMYGFCEVDLMIGNENVKRIIDKNLVKYPKSSFFLYFKGKYFRLMKNLPEALKAFEDATSKSEKYERIVEILVIEQKAWLHMMNLNYSKALELFDVMSKESKWSALLHTYICSLLSGCIANFNEAATYGKLAFEKAKDNIHGSGFQYEVLALKRCNYFRIRQIGSTTIYELLVLELLLLWACLPYCDENALNKMLDICERCTDASMRPLRYLIEGVIYLAKKNEVLGEQRLKECIEFSKKDDIPFCDYAAPCACYELAMMCTLNGNYEEARVNLSRARDSYKDYDLENRIQSKFQNLSRRLRAIGDENSNKKLVKKNF